MFGDAHQDFYNAKYVPWFKKKKLGNTAIVYVCASAVSAQIALACTCVVRCVLCQPPCL